MIIEIVKLKIATVFFFEKLAKAFVILDLSVSLTSTSSLLVKIFNKEGSKEKVRIRKSKRRLDLNDKY